MRRPDDDRPADFDGTTDKPTDDCIDAGSNAGSDRWFNVRSNSGD